jgi:hypothetical protein
MCYDDYETKEQTKEVFQKLHLERTKEQLEVFVNFAETASRIHSKSLLGWHTVE